MGSVMLELLCKLFGHRRSKKDARRVGVIWQSRCVLCHEPLVRLAPGQWVERSSTAGKEFMEAAEQPFERPLPDTDRT
jgi:hypothetical protein